MTLALRSRRLVLHGRFMVLLLAVLSVGVGPAAAAPLPPQIHTLAGGIGTARSVAELPGGGFLYVDATNDLVREVSSSGSVTTVAGDGTTTDSDGGPAVNSGLNGPVSVAVLPGGGFLITEYNGSVVRMVSTDGTITTIAGTGSPNSNAATSGPATSVGLNYPSDAEALPDGSVLIADTYNNVIREVSPSGTMTTIAGGGGCDDATESCDGSAAGAVGLHHPDSVSPIQNGAGGYLVAEYDNATIRQVSQVSPFGTFTTVAGTPGQTGYSGDGGPATSAQLNHPEGVLSTPDGGFLIADTNNQRIRQVSSSGTITTVAGNGVATFAGDGGNATDASLNSPVGVSQTPDGGFLIADADNGRIRAVTVPPTTSINVPTPTGNNGWFNTAAHVSVTATNGKKTNCQADPLQAPPAFDAIPTGCLFRGKGADITGDGTHTIYAASVDAAGDKEIPVSATLMIDTTPPTLACTGSPSFVIGTRGAVASAAVSDSLSGPASPTATAPVDTSFLGSYGVTIDGFDRAGNEGQVGCDYTVVPAALHPTPRLIWSFSSGSRATTIRRLLVTQVPGGAQVNVTCAGAGCPFSVKRNVTAKHLKRGTSASARSHTIDLGPLLGYASLARGAKLSVSVTEANTLGRVWSFTVKGKAKPAVNSGCLQPGSLTTQAHC